VLVTPEEARHAKEFNNYYVILPEDRWRTRDAMYADGLDLPSGFYFASHNNASWLDEAGLRKLMESLN
jgi:UDP-N-acetylglucosamine 4,6-dehydratase